MKAMVFTRYGSPDVLRLEEVDQPAPADNEVLVKISATGLNALDWRILHAKPFLVRFFFGFFKPKKSHILGADIAGTVEAVGKNVTRFQPGDEVFGDTFESGLGGFAEFACVREDLLVKIPSGVTFEQAAALPVPGYTVLQGLRDKGKIQAGQKVLIHGASGGVGTLAIQIAKAYGAEITAVCSTRNVEMVRLLGADHVVDYTREDFTKNGQQYDLIFAANGARSIFAYKRSLSPQGSYVCAGGSLKQMFQTILLGPWMAKVSQQKFVMVSASSNLMDLEALAELIAGGKIKPVIDKVYPLAQLPEAIRYMLEVHAQGKIIIAM